MITLRFGEHFIIERRSKGEKKRSRMHRAAVTGLAVILAALLCAGCGNTEQATTAPVQPQTTAEATAPAVTAPAVTATAKPEAAEPEQSSAPVQLLLLLRAPPPVSQPQALPALRPIL